MSLLEAAKRCQQRLFRLRTNGSDGLRANSTHSHRLSRRTGAWWKVHKILGLLVCLRLAPVCSPAVFRPAMKGTSDGSRTFMWVVMFHSSGAKTAVDLHKQLLAEPTPPRSSSLNQLPHSCTRLTTVAVNCFRVTAAFSQLEPALADYLALRKIWTRSALVHIPLLRFFAAVSVHVFIKKKKKRVTRHCTCIIIFNCTCIIIFNCTCIIIFNCTCIIIFNCTRSLTKYRV